MRSSGCSTRRSPFPRSTSHNRGSIREEASETGGFTLFEAVRHFLEPYVPKVGWFPLLAAVLSAISGLLLWQYQRYVGKKSGSMAFIAQSVDSRNHVIVALGVTAGLIASLLRFGVLDMLVGLVVALLILWSAIRLAVELVRSGAEGEVNLSRYGFWLEEVYESALERYLRDSMVELVARGEGGTKAELTERVRCTLDFRGNSWLQAIGLDRQLASDALIDTVLRQVIEKGWVSDGEPLAVTSDGRSLLARRQASRRHHRRGRQAHRRER